MKLRNGFVSNSSSSSFVIKKKDLHRGEEQLRLIKEHSDLFNPKTHYKLRYDFFLPEEKTLIEYQGAQHYFPISSWGGLSTLEGQQCRDELKRNYAKKNNIKLLEIDYRENNNIDEILMKNISTKEENSIQ